MNSSLKDIFFLGAGFSKAVLNRMPTMKMLSNSLISSSAKSDTDLPKNSDNFEYILTYLSQNLPWEDRKNAYEKKCTLLILRREYLPNSLITMNY